MQIYFASKSSVYLTRKNMVSDKKSKLINEVVDGIRMIKMYGWEIAFKRIIDTLRDNETGQLMSRAIVSCIESGLSNSASLIAAFISFLAIYYSSKDASLLNSAKIFSTIELLQFLRLNILNFSAFGIYMVFELKVFLKRYIQIISIKDTKMEQIAEG